MATHSSVFAWRIPGTEAPVGLPSMGSHRVGHDWRLMQLSSSSSSMPIFGLEKKFTAGFLGKWFRYFAVLRKVKSTLFSLLLQMVKLRCRKLICWRVGPTLGSPYIWVSSLAVDSVHGRDFLQNLCIILAPLQLQTKGSSIFSRQTHWGREKLTDERKRHKSQGQNECQRWNKSLKKK